MPAKKPAGKATKPPREGTFAAFILALPPELSVQERVVRARASGYPKANVTSVYRVHWTYSDFLPRAAARDSTQPDVARSAIVAGTPSAELVAMVLKHGTGATLAAVRIAEQRAEHLGATAERRSV